jgi:hypothetical protein
MEKTRGGYMMKKTLFEQPTGGAGAFADMPAGYGALGDVFAAVTNRVAAGKGLERHATEFLTGEVVPFQFQPLLSICRMVGLGYPLGQAAKKGQEAVSLAAAGDAEGARDELLDAIAYLAGGVLAVEEIMRSEDRKAVGLALSAGGVPPGGGFFCADPPPPPDDDQVDRVRPSPPDARLADMWRNCRPLDEILSELKLYGLSAGEVLARLAIMRGGTVEISVASIAEAVVDLGGRASASIMAPGGYFLDDKAATAVQVIDAANASRAPADRIPYFEGEGKT